MPTHEFGLVPLYDNRLIFDKRGYDVNILQETVQRDSVRLNTNQRVAFDALCQAVLWAPVSYCQVAIRLMDETPLRRIRTRLSTEDKLYTALGVDWSPACSSETMFGSR